MIYLIYIILYIYILYIYIHPGFKFSPFSPPSPSTRRVGLPSDLLTHVYVLHLYRYLPIIYIYIY